MKTIAVIPAYNEHVHIGDVVRSTRQFVDEVIVVDDSSKDNTYDLAKSAGAHVLRHRLNLGKAGALKTGCQAALGMGAEILVFLDSDGQHKPEDIPSILRPLEEQRADFVIGTREGGDRMPFFRRAGNTAVFLAIRLLFGVNIIDVNSGFRAFLASVYPKISWKSKQYHADAEMIARVGYHRLRYAKAPIETIYHDSYKGMTVFDGLKLLGNIIIWKFTL